MTRTKQVGRSWIGGTVVESAGGAAGAFADDEGEVELEELAAQAGKAAASQTASPTGVRSLRLLAHDVNNVLSVMLIYSELIERCAQGERVEGYIAQVRAAAERGSELTGELRQMARLSAAEPQGAQGAAPQSVPIPVLHAIRDLTGPVAAPRGVGVVVVDDHRMFAEGLGSLLDLEDGIEVLGVGTSGLEAVTLVDQLRPQVLLLDFDMPGGDGLWAAAQVKAAWPQTMVLMVTGVSDDQLPARAAQAGCSGYLTKNRAVSEVADAVRVVATGAVLA